MKMFVHDGFDVSMKLHTGISFGMVLGCGRIEVRGVGHLIINVQVIQHILGYYLVLECSWGQEGSQ